MLASALHACDGEFDQVVEVTATVAVTVRLLFSGAVGVANKLTKVTEKRQR